jgi:hypothetical protein
MLPCANDAATCRADSAGSDVDVRSRSGRTTPWRPWRGRSRKGSVQRPHHRRVRGPSANHRIEVADQLRRAKRDAALRLPADRVLEPVDRLLGRIRIETSTSRRRRDLRGWQIQRPLAALDRVAEKREAPAHVHDARLSHIELHPKGCEDRHRASQYRVSW